MYGVPRLVGQTTASWTRENVQIQGHLDLDISNDTWVVSYRAETNQVGPWSMSGHANFTLHNRKGSGHDGSLQYLPSHHVIIIPGTCAGDS
jgi:hypothetical protein